MLKSFWKNKSGGNNRGNHDKKYANRGSFNGSRGMHKATCDKCGQPCEVPFKPTNGKPLFCRDCFSKDGAGPSRSRAYTQNGAGKANTDQFKVINDKLDRILKLLNQ